MAISTVTTKGQVTIPKDVRERLGLRAGDQIEWVEDKVGFHLRKKVAASPFDRYRGYLRDFAGQDPDSLVEEMRGR